MASLFELGLQSSAGMGKGVNDFYNSFVETKRRNALDSARAELAKRMGEAPLPPPNMTLEEGAMFAHNYITPFQQHQVMFGDDSPLKAMKPQIDGVLGQIDHENQLKRIGAQSDSAFDRALLSDQSRRDIADLRIGSQEEIAAKRLRQQLAIEEKREAGRNRRAGARKTDTTRKEQRQDYKDYDSAVKAATTAWAPQEQIMNKVRVAFRTIEDAALNEGFTGTADSVMAMMFNKLLDPDSVVREGEYDRVKGYETMYSRLRDVIGEAKRKFQGKFITGPMRDEILDLSGKLMEINLDVSNTIADRHRRSLDDAAEFYNQPERKGDYSRLYSPDGDPAVLLERYRRERKAYPAIWAFDELIAEGRTNDPRVLALRTLKKNDPAKFRSVRRAQVDKLKQAYVGGL